MFTKNHRGVFLLFLCSLGANFAPRPTGVFGPKSMRELRRPSGRLHLLALACVALGGAADDWSHCEELLELASRGGASVELPTVVLVGHRNDGKSSLLEALLGLKLTLVGHDEATRRPLEIRAQRDEAAAEPAIFPPPADLARLEMLRDFDPALRRTLSRLWTEIKVR